MAFRIRQTDDLDTVVELNKEIFPVTGAISDEDLHRSVWWVAEHRWDMTSRQAPAEWEPVGFGGCCVAPKGAYMTRAGVLKEWRGRGVQQRLIRAREAWARCHRQPRIYTYVWSGNVASMRSLCKCGYLPYFCEYVSETRCTYVYLEKKLGAAAQAA